MSRGNPTDEQREVAYRVMDEECEAHGITRDRLLSRGVGSKTRAICRCRSIVARRLVYECDISRNRAAECLNRDHAAIIKMLRVSESK